MQGRSGASGKVAGCQWGDLHRLADGHLRVNFKRLKGGKQATDFLAVPVATAVQTWLHGYYGTALGDLSADTPLWVSLAGNGTGGGPVSAIQKLLRDSSLATTGIYLAQLTADGNPAVDKLAALVAGEPEPAPPRMVSPRHRKR